jgi:penicillin-binding protein 1B
MFMPDYGLFSSLIQRVATNGTGGKPPARKRKPASDPAWGNDPDSRGTPSRARKVSKDNASSRKKTPPRNTAPASRGFWRTLGVWLLRLSLLGMVVLAVLMVFLDAQMRQQFEGRKWTLPARVYARPMLLYPGQLLSHEQLAAELRWTDYHPLAGAPRSGSFERSGNDWAIYRRNFVFWDGPEPAVRIQVSLENGHISRLLVDGSDQPMVRLEPQYIGGIFPAHNEDRELVKLDQVPSELLGALVVTEDKDFFSHWGVSPRGIVRAMWVNLEAGAVVQGGSTLTQQLVKNFYLTDERSLVRKAREALMALLLEMHYSKGEILQTYINEVYLGQAGRRAIHGFALASRFYFGKPLNELDIGEMATLVGLVKGASYYNPKKHPQRAKERRDLILGLMRDNGVISANQYVTAVNTALNTSDSKRAGQREYPAFLELVKAQLQQDYRQQDLENEGLNIFTTLDPWMQYNLEVAATGQLERLEKGRPELADKLETAAVVTSVDGGEVRALLGSRHPGYFGFNRAVNASRPIGSLAKPVVYLTALQSGRFNWGSPLDDSPLRLEIAGAPDWTPSNYDRRSHGVVPMVDALAHSYNLSTARMGLRVGVDEVAKTFRTLGVSQDIAPYPSLLLGSLELSPMQVASLYQPLAAQGFRMPLRTVEGVTTQQGQTLSSYAVTGQQVVDPMMVAWLRYGLEAVVERGTAKKLLTRLPGPLAGKTGTSDDQRDAWFAGFDNRNLGVVWVGRDDNQSMPFAGASAALPIWMETFEKSGVDPLPPQPQMIQVAVDDQGNQLGEGCSGTWYPFPPEQVDAGVMPCISVPEPPPPAEEKKKRGGLLDWLF